MMRGLSALPVASTGADEQIRHGCLCHGLALPILSAPVSEMSTKNCDASAYHLAEFAVVRATPSAARCAPLRMPASFGDALQAVYGLELTSPLCVLRTASRTHGRAAVGEFDIANAWVVKPTPGLGAVR